MNIEEEILEPLRKLENKFRKHTEEERHLGGGYYHPFTREADQLKEIIDKVEQLRGNS